MKQEPINTKPLNLPELTFVERFLINRTGVEPDELVRKSHTEISRYSCSGAAIVLTTALAFISALYGLYTIFESSLVVYPAMIWAAIVYFLDKALICSWYKVSESNGSKAFMLGMRLSIALIISFIISAPLESALFHKEIALYHKQEITLTSQKLKQVNPVVEDLENKIKILEEEIKVKEKERKDAYDAYTKEVEGKAGSGIEGYGRIAKEKEEEFLKQDTKLKELELKNNALIDKYREQVEVEKSKLGEMNNSVVNAQEEATSLPSQIRILSAIAQKDETTWYIRLAITVLFAAVECFPILIKILVGSGPYERYLNQVEYMKLQKIEKFKTLTDELLKDISTNQLEKEVLIREFMQDWQDTVHTNFSSNSSKNSNDVATAEFTNKNNSTIDPYDTTRIN